MPRHRRMPSRGRAGRRLPARFPDVKYLDDFLAQFETLRREIEQSRTTPDRSPPMDWLFGRDAPRTHTGVRSLRGDFAASSLRSAPETSDYENDDEELRGDPLAECSMEASLTLSEDSTLTMTDITEASTLDSVSTIAPSTLRRRRSFQPKRTYRICDPDESQYWLQMHAASCEMKTPCKAPSNSKLLRRWSTKDKNQLSLNPSPRPPPFPQLDMADGASYCSTHNTNTTTTTTTNNNNTNPSAVSQSDSRLSFASSSTGYSSARSSLRSTEGTDDEHHDLLFSAANSLSECRRRTLIGNGGLTRLQMIACELLETERSYVNDLWQVIQGYLNYLVDSRDQLELTVDEVSHTFGCVERIFQLNRRLYVRLDETELDCIDIARCFIDFAGCFDDYVTYCTNYQRMLSTLSTISTRPIVAEALQRRQQQLGHSLPLSSYLLKPVQRILKYHLFIEHMLKELTTIGVSSDELKIVKKALEVMTAQAGRINDEKKRVEHQERVQQLHAQIGRLKSNEPAADLAAYGELLLEAAFRVAGSKATRLLFLFEEMLMIVKQKGSQYVCKDYIMCSNLMLNEVVSEDPLAFQVLSFDNPRSQYIFVELKRMVLDHYEVAIPEETKKLMLSMDHTQPKVSFVSARNHRKFPKYLEKRRKSVERKEKEEKRDDSPNRRRRSLSASRLTIEALTPSNSTEKKPEPAVCTCASQAGTSSSKPTETAPPPRQRIFETKKSRHIGLPRHDKHQKTVDDSCLDDAKCTCPKKKLSQPCEPPPEDFESTFADLYKSLTMLGVENVGAESSQRSKHPLAAPCDTAAASRRLDDLVRKYSSDAEPVRMRSKSLTRLDQVAIIRQPPSTASSPAADLLTKPASLQVLRQQETVPTGFAMGKDCPIPSRPHLLRPSTAVDPRLLSPDAGPLERWQLKRLLAMGPAPPVPNRRTPLLSQRRQRAPLTPEQTQRFEDLDPQLGVVREMVRQYEGAP